MISFFIFSISPNCKPFLSTSIVYIYFIITFITITGIVLLTYSIAQSKMNAQVIVALQSLFNEVIMFISTLLVIIMHFIYQHAYPLQRDSRSSEAPCILHSAMSVVMLLIPSESLIVMTVIHYRIIFWSRYTKVPIKVALLVAIITWVVAIVLAGVWTFLQSHYIGWYCLPYAMDGESWWVSVLIKSIITLLTIISAAVCISCNTKILLYLHKEEVIVKKMLTRKVSNVRNLFHRFTITFMLYFAESVAMNTLIWLPTINVALEVTESLMYICYIFSVVMSDSYLYVYVIAKRRIDL